ncbi:hypothetical protein R6Z07F_009816 [Ovis aries]
MLSAAGASACGFRSPRFPSGRGGRPGVRLRARRAPGAAVRGGRARVGRLGPAPARRFDVGAGTARPSSRPPRAGALLRLSVLKQRGGSGMCLRGGGAERRERRSNGIGRPRLTPANRRSRRKGLCDRETLKSCPCPPPSSFLAAADK